MKARTRKRVISFGVVLLACVIALIACSAYMGLSAQEANTSDVSTFTPAQQTLGVPAQKIDQPVQQTAAAEDENSSADSDINAKNGGESNKTAVPSAADAHASSTLEVRFLDVGQGDCALLTCEGAHLLIDGGPPEASQKVYASLARLGVDHLDVIIATHPDADHIAGISAALNYATAGVCYCSTTESDTKTFANMVRYLKAANCPLVVPDVPSSFALGGATVTFLGPTQTRAEDNNNSLVCRVDFGDTSFLFTGDAQTEEENDLLDARVSLHANVLKVAHHGSASSTSEQFLSAVSPEAAIISVGNNSYGHPTQEVLERLNNAGVAVWRTDEVGDIVATSDGTRVSITEKS